MHRILLQVSAVLYLAAGALFLFLPREIAPTIGLPPIELPLQLFAAGLLAMGWLNWMSRGVPVGGIYGRPISIANVAFAVAAAGSVLSGVLDGDIGPIGWIPAAVFGLLAAGFFWAMRSQPTQH